MSLPIPLQENGKGRDSLVYFHLLNPSFCYNGALELIFIEVMGKGNKLSQVNPDWSYQCAGPWVTPSRHGKVLYQASGCVLNTDMWENVSSHQGWGQSIWFQFNHVNSIWSCW